MKLFRVAASLMGAAFFIAPFATATEAAHKRWHCEADNPHLAVSACAKGGVRHILLFAALVLWVAPAAAHGPYEKKYDPIFHNLCCGGEDCAVLAVTPGMLTGEADGYRLRMSLEQARQINPLRKDGVDTLIVWERVQPSWDGNYHLCLRTSDAMADPANDRRGPVYCFWAPPNT